MEGERRAGIRFERTASGRAGAWRMLDRVAGNRGGICVVTQPSSVATSGARPGDGGNDAGSSAGCEYWPEDGWESVMRVILSDPTTEG